MKTTTWILHEKAGKRFHQGHPWVFANELTESPKGLAPGHPVELRTPRGRFLARGYGNPHSLICFRTLSRRESELDPWSGQRLAEKVMSAWHWRKQLGLSEFSHRLIFGEADQLPGLVMDRFVNKAQDRQVLVLQLLTAGAELMLPDPAAWVRQWVQEVTGIAVAKTILVVRREVGARKLEGLKFEAPQVFDLGQVEGAAVSTAEVNDGDGLSTPVNSERAQELLGEAFPAWIRAADGDGGLTFQLDLISGQKTGFFFDQASNLELLLKSINEPQQGQKRVLDLFCYVGQWGAQVSRFLKKQGCDVYVDLVDGSASALKLAIANVEAQGGRVMTHELDILDGLHGVSSADVVICDPPAFIKNKKDHGAGLKGYVKANAMALEKVLPGGYFVSCSCSHHLSDSDMVDVLRQAEAKAERRVRWLGRGIQAPDHPVRLSFPEGQYLKAWVGRVE